VITVAGQRDDAVDVRGDTHEHEQAAVLPSADAGGDDGVHPGRIDERALVEVHLTRCACSRDSWSVCSSCGTVAMSSSPDTRTMAAEYPPCDHDHEQAKGTLGEASGLPVESDTTSLRDMSTFR
jgi:hypothetical protein